MPAPTDADRLAHDARVVAAWEYAHELAGETHGANALACTTGPRGTALLLALEGSPVDATAEDLANIVVDHVGRPL